MEDIQTAVREIITGVTTTHYGSVEREREMCPVLVLDNIYQGEIK